MDLITLYTNNAGYYLAREGKPFIASLKRDHKSDYKVIAPKENLIAFPLKDDKDCFDVVRHHNVMVEKISS